MELADRLREAVADRYAVEGELGRGGMAVVYLARDLRHERRVAIKVLRPELTITLVADRFLREIQIAAQLQHPLIVPLYDSGGSDQLLWYVMPYVEGETLRQRLQREPQLSLEDALQIAHDAAEALTCAHQHGFVHRDIKPENILLSGGHAMLTDFGIARALTRAAGEGTSSGVAIGTPAYMSPEQASGGATIDARSDVYSLGCLLYEMLAGEPPFTGPTPQAVIARHVSQAPPPVRVVRPAVPADIEAAIERALAKAPADRFQTAAEFGAALAGPGPARRGWRRRGLRIAAFLAVLAVLAAIVRQVGIPTPPVRDPGSVLDPTHVAVLFFDDLSPAGSLGHVAHGLALDLIDELSRVAALHVVPPSGVRSFAGRSASLDSIARTLRVGTLVEGSVTASEDTLRITVRLVDAAFSRQIGSQTLQRSLAEFWALQDELASQVAWFLRRQLGREIALRERQARAPSFEAWRLLQLAEEARQESLALLRGGNPSTAGLALRQADSLAAESERIGRGWIEPSILRGWVALDQANVAEATRRPIGPSGEDSRAAADSAWLAVGLRHAARALERRRDDPRALELRGTLRARLLHRVRPELALALADSADADLRAAVSERPSAARAWVSLSRVYTFKGDLAASGQATRRAVESDAYLSEANRALANLLFVALRQGDYAEADKLCLTGRQFYPAETTFRECELTILGWSGTGPSTVEAAWRLLGSIEREDTLDLLRETRSYRRMMVAAVLARSGMRDSAKRVASSARGIAGGDVSANFAEAYVYTLLADTTQATALLRELLDALPHRREFVGTHPWFRTLRTSPAFQALIAPRP